MQRRSGPDIVKQYITRARRALDDDQIDICIHYAEQALQVDSSNGEAQAIIDEATARSRNKGFFRKSLGYRRSWNPGRPELPLQRRKRRLERVGYKQQSPLFRLCRLQLLQFSVLLAAVELAAFA